MVETFFWGWVCRTGLNECGNGMLNERWNGLRSERWNVDDQIVQECKTAEKAISYISGNVFIFSPTQPAL